MSYKLIKFDERNVVKKRLSRIKVKVALCYPSIYKVAISSLGYQLLYFILNSEPEIACERVVLSTLSGREPPPKSIESSAPLREFDVVLFSVHYELDYVNIARILISAGINPSRYERKENDPMVIVGGPPVTANPRPLENIADACFIGEAEPSLIELVYEAAEVKQNRESLPKLAEIDGTYVPGVSDRTERVWVKDLDKVLHPTRQILPITEHRELEPVFGKAAQIEVTRGCGRGCRFCLLGYCFRPYRERSLTKIKELVDKTIENSQVDKIVLIGSSLSDYKNLLKLLEYCKEKELSVSLPALRTDAVEDDVLKLMAELGQRTLTIAPESSERIRLKLNKPIENSEIINKCLSAVKLGIRNIKLYFLYGIPGEEKEDFNEIAELVKEIKTRLKLSRENIRVSINPLIPKAHTPLQWIIIEDKSILQKKRAFLEKILKPVSRVEGYSPFDAQIQAILSLGDSSLSEVITYAAKLGGGKSGWRKALSSFSINPQKYLKKMIELKPWSVVETGVKEEYLRKEYEKFLSAEITPACFEKCTQCGVC